MIVILHPDTADDDPDYARLRAYLDRLPDIRARTHVEVGTQQALKIGTRNNQNFELLKAVGRQREFPVLLERGFAITLEESLNAALVSGERRQPQRDLLP